MKNTGFKIAKNLSAAFLADLLIGQILAKAADNGKLPKNPAVVGLISSGMFCMYILSIAAPLISKGETK